MCVHGCLHKLSIAVVFRVSCRNITTASIVRDAIYNSFQRKALDKEMGKLGYKNIETFLMGQVYLCVCACSVCVRVFVHLARYMHTKHTYKQTIHISTQNITTLPKHIE
jgi:hypothetical protein